LKIQDREVAESPGEKWGFAIINESRDGICIEYTSIFLLCNAKNLELETKMKKLGAQMPRRPIFRTSIKP
jgi:hypothetical protein